MVFGSPGSYFHLYRRVEAYYGDSYSDGFDKIPSSSVSRQLASVFESNFVKNGLGPFPPHPDLEP